MGMTGDGAVVRVDHAKAASWARDLTHNPMRDDPTGGFANLARAYLAQAAEIERLTERVNQFDCCMCGSPMDGHNIGSGHSPVSMYDYHLDQAQQHAKASEARIADLLKALGAADRLVDWLRINRERRELPADFEEVAAIVAPAKGETV